MASDQKNQKPHDLLSELLKKELDAVDNTSGDDEKVNLAPSEVVFKEPNFNGKSGLCGIFRGIGPDGKRIAIWSVTRFKKI